MTTHTEEHGKGGHVVPLPVLVGTWAALVVLTWLTVSATYLDLGNLNIVIALFVAVVKSALVVLFFMHLIDEKKLIYWLMALAVVFFIFAMVVPLVTESNTIHVGS